MGILFVTELNKEIVEEKGLQTSNERTVERVRKFLKKKGEKISIGHKKQQESLPTLDLLDRGKGLLLSLID